eukprot:885318_1
MSRSLQPPLLVPQWYSRVRKRTISKIQTILEERINDRQRYRHLIHNLAKRVEWALYRDARSIEVYANALTLRNRVKQTLWEMKQSMASNQRLECMNNSKKQVRAPAA